MFVRKLSLAQPEKICFFHKLIKANSKASSERSNHFFLLQINNNKYINNININILLFSSSIIHVWMVSHKCTNKNLKNCVFSVLLQQDSRQCFISYLIHNFINFLNSHKYFLINLLIDYQQEFVDKLTKR